MKTLLIHPCEPSVGSWVRGEFIDQRTVITWAKEDGREFIYTLSPRYMYTFTKLVVPYICDWIKILPNFC